MSMKKVMMVGAGVLAAQSSLAADAVNWSFKGKEASLGAEYRFEHVYDDHKAEDVNVDNAGTIVKNEGKATSEFTMPNARLRFKGKMSDRASFYFRLNLPGGKVVDGKAPDLVNYAYVDYKLTDMISMTFGKDKVIQGGGWEYYASSYDMIIKGDYLGNNLPYSSEYDKAISVNFDLGDAGRVRYQVTNDYGSVWTEGAQPAHGLEYRGKFAGVEPIFQYASYDMNHSNVITVGVKQDTEMYKVAFDVVMESRAKKDAADKEVKDSLSSYTLAFNYLMGETEPFVKFSVFDNKQDGTDSKGNDFYDEDNSEVKPTWKDNGTHWVVGSFFMKDGEMVKPFLAYSSHSGKVYDPVNTGSKTATVTNSKVHFGIAGTF